ncbi:MAG TPA: DUF4331 family protein [Candidatus Limnocylindrales bacterium]|jgi:hypothetical protein|nr:DUF4331 family protein [Candidatus Limnocylindrales bacterium]
MLRSRLTALGAALTVLTLGAAPFLANAADHLDAPALGGTVVAGEFAPHSEHGDRDINDLYVFTAPDAANRTAIALTVNPAINLFGGNFGTNVRYIINIDTNGDLVQDIAYIGRFEDADAAGNQKWKLSRYTGDRAVSLTGGRTVAQGTSNDGTKTIGTNHEWAWAGVRSDPFFFDLTGFIGTTTLLTTGTAVGGDGLGTDPTDFFAHLNTNAIVLTLPNAMLPNAINVWATTTWYDGTSWQPGDQMARPAINTVFNPSVDKNLFNRTRPSQQLTASGGKFFNNVVNGLLFFSSLDSEGAYTEGQAEALAGVLIPDVLPYSRTSTLPAPLNGRGLADDVIDVELNVTTGGDPLDLFADRNATGAVPGDGVGPHSDYLSVFPYLGVPH